MQAQAIQKNITANYIEPTFIHCKAITYLALAELVKVLAAQKFLEIILNHLVLGDVSKKIYNKSYTTTIIAPVLEEIIFRGFLLRRIKLTQFCWDYYLRGNVLSEDQKKARLYYRVQISSLIFGAMHAFNDHPNLYAKFIQCSWCYICGVAYAYVSEKYQTLAAGILAHGINNCLSVALYHSKNLQHDKLIICAIPANLIMCYMFAGFNIPKVAGLKIYHSVSYCVSIPIRSINWVRNKAMPQQNGDDIVFGEA